jgi:Ca2+-binding EF-hand superfamily protein
MIVAAPLLVIMLQAAAPAAKAPATPAPQSVTKAAVQAQVKSNFDRLDTNKDGAVDKAEAQKAHEANVAAVTKRRNELAAATFAKADTDKNGALSLKEFEAAAPMPKMDSTWLDTNDTNKDGKVSLTEVNSRAMASFDKVDSNKDGVLSAQEARAAQRRQ